MTILDASRISPASPSDISSRPRGARILVDLSHAADGYVGIAQDTRLNFDMLASLDGVDVAGLLLPAGRHDLPRMSRSKPRGPALEAGVLHWMARNWETRRYPNSLRLPIEIYETLRNEYQMHPLAETNNAIWRILFDKTLAAGRRDAILSRPFYATDLSVSRIIDRTMRLPTLPPKKLAAEGFDFVLFCMPRPVRLPAGVRQLVRFHDAVPLTDVDTQSSWQSALAHQELTRRCERSAVFVCNSPQSLADLVQLDRKREGTAHVIPCALAPAQPRPPQIPFGLVARMRRSARAIGPEKTPLSLPKLPPGEIRYILSVGTLEPRKNHVKLIRAWERITSRSDPSLKLVIVGNPGWQQEPILATMQPHVAEGSIIHLERLSHDELVSVAAGAECFVFPSYNEGFGYPPLEALQAGTPSVLSDIPVFRWIFGDGAVYADPYDVEAIADGIERLVSPSTRDALRAEVLSHRRQILDRFSETTIRDQWATLLDQLTERRTAR